jgi:hypothetical protein
MNWPDTVKLSKKAKERVEAAGAMPQMAAWPEGVKFEEAEQAEAIAFPLIAELHKHLVNANIAYLFRQHVGGRGVTLAGKTKLASGLIKHLTKFDFVLEINWTLWSQAPIETRVALIDHELSHCGREEEGGFCILQHDLEEFNAVVARWGLWNQGVRQFADVCAQQLELLPS